MQPRHPAWPVLLGQVPPLADPFIPRQETVPGLAAGLQAGETVALVPGSGPPGPGGTGKTTLAAGLAHAHRDNHLVDLVLWVTATSRDAVVSSYAQALREVGVPAPEEDAGQAASAFLSWLAGSGRSWLVVLDDLGAEAAPDELWPRGAGGRVLVTASQQAAVTWIPGARLVPVGTFSPREALSYLFAKLHADPDQRNGALDLATGLGFLPSALAQAAAVVAEAGMDCRQYLTELARRQAARGGSAAGDLAVVAAEAWSLSAGFADHLQPAGLARRVLAFLSVLAPGGIPGAIITSEPVCAYLGSQAGAAVADPAQARAAVQNLARAGLVTIDPDSSAATVLIHPAVQGFARHQLSAGERDQAARAAADALAATWSIPAMPPAVAQALRDCTVALCEMDTPALWAPECHPALLQAGQSLDSSGMTAAAAGYWQRLLEAAERYLGPGHPQTALLSDLLGAAYAADGRLDQAAALYERSLADRERAVGPDARGMLATRLRLARAYRTHHRPVEAVQLAGQVATESDRLLGAGDPDSLAAYVELALACLSAARPKDAVAAAQHVLARREQALGPGHPDALDARDLLAGIHQASGRFKDAIALSRRTLADRERVQGPGHPAVLATRVRLALAYRSAGKLKDAIRLYQRTLADREQVQGPDHLDTIRARTDLALAYYTARKFPVSISEYERALADCERVLGPAHPFTRETRENLNDAAVAARSILGIDLRSPDRA